MAKKAEFSWTLGTPSSLWAWIDGGGGLDGDRLRVCVHGSSRDADGRLQLDDAWECRAVAEWLMKAADVLDSDRGKKKGT